MFDNRGRFLFIEEKHHGETMLRGQERALQALSHHHDVWVVTGTPKTLTVDVWVDGTSSPHPTFPSGDWDDYQKAVLGWFSHDTQQQYGSEWFDKP